MTNQKTMRTFALYLSEEAYQVLEMERIKQTKNMVAPDKKDYYAQILEKEAKRLKKSLESEK